eukprot:s138_g18.t4
MSSSCEESPLHAAAASGSVEVVQLLMSAGAEKDHVGQQGSVPLHLASLNGHLDVVRALVEAGADKNKADCLGAAPLHLAAEQGCPPVVQYLLEVNADQDQPDGDHNVSCDYEVRKDRQGNVRHYVSLRARVAVPPNTELLLSSGEFSGGMPSVALEACKARPPKPYTSEPFALTCAAKDFVDGVLPYSTGLEVKYSNVHGNGVYAKKAFKEGEMVEFAPSGSDSWLRMGGLLADYRYSAESLREGLFRIVLGCGSIYNHSAVPNLGYRRVRVDESSEAVQGLSVCYYAKRDIADALIDVLQVRVSRRNARRLFRQLAAQPCSQRAAIGSVGTTAQLTQLTQLGKPSGDGSSHESHESPAISPPRQEQTAQTAQSARSQPEKGLNRSQSETRTRPKTTRVEVGVTKRPSLGVHLQEQMRQHWQGGLREKREEKSNKAASRPQKIRETREKSESPDTSKLSSRRSSLKTPPPVQPSNSTGALPPAVNRRSYEVWRRDVSLKSLLAFEAEVKARQESSTTSSEDGAEANRELPGSSRSSKLPSSDSPPSSLRLRRSSEEERLEALPARLAEAMEALGIMAAYCPDYDGLVIEGLTEESDTAIAEWNQEHPEAELLAGLAILEVNGRRKGEEIMAQLRRGNSSDILEMLVTQNLTPVQWTILREAKRKKRCLERAKDIERLLEGLEAKLGDGEDAKDECCSICLDQLQDGNVMTVIVRLPCGHHFHKICAAKWFASGKRKLLSSLKILAPDGPGFQKQAERRGREKTRWRLPQAVHGSPLGEAFPGKGSGKMSMTRNVFNSTGDFKRLRKNPKMTAIHSDVLLAQVASPKTRLPLWPTVRPADGRGHPAKEDELKRTASHPVKLPSASQPVSTQLPATPTPAQPALPAQPSPTPATASTAPAATATAATEAPAAAEAVEGLQLMGPFGRRQSKAEKIERNETVPVSNKPVGKDDRPLVPSVDDCLDRYYTDLVPAEDVQRMRVMLGQYGIFSRFSNSNFEVTKEDLPELLGRLCFFLVTAEARNLWRSEADGREVQSDCQRVHTDFYERYAHYERQNLHGRLKRWRPNPYAREDADFALQNIRHEKCGVDRLAEEVAGLKRHDCDHAIALIRFLAAYRSCEGFTVAELEKLTEAFHHCESDVVNLGPEGRLIRTTELARGLLRFGGLYCIDHLQALINTQWRHFEEKTHGICFYEFLVNARQLRQMELSEVAGYFNSLDTDKGNKGISDDSRLSFDAAYDFVIYVRERSQGMRGWALLRKNHSSVHAGSPTRPAEVAPGYRNGFTQNEKAEFLKTFDHFCKSNREMPTLQVMELLSWQGFKNRVEDGRCSDADVWKMVQQVDFNENGTMDATEYLRLMRLQKEVKLSVYRKVFQRRELATVAITKELLKDAFLEADLNAPPRLVEEAFISCISEQGQVSSGLSWDLWVRVAEQIRKLIPVENRKQATFSDAELDQLRTAFDLQSSDGFVSKGQLLWMLADSGMPVNKASGRRDLYLSLDRARRKALDAGVPEEDVGQLGSPRIRFFPVVHLARAFLKNLNQKVLEREEAAMRAVRFSSTEVMELRSLFEREAQECIKEEQHDKEGDEPQKRSLGTVIRLLGQEARVPISRVILMTARIGARIKISQKEDAPRIDFPCFLQLMQWMLDCNFGDINSAAERSMKG